MFEFFAIGEVQVCQNMPHHTEQTVTQRINVQVKQRGY